MEPLTRRLPRLVNATLPLLQRTARTARVGNLPFASLRKTASHSTFSKRVSLTLGGKFLAYDNVFLRDACTCPRCVHPSTQQKLFRTADIPLDISPTAAETLADGSLRITWNQRLTGEPAEPHVSLYSREFLSKGRNLRERVRGSYNDQTRELWDRATMQKKNKWMDYNEYMTGGDSVLFSAVKQLEKFGLLFINNIPDNSDAVEGIAERIGNLKDTFYGKTWDVKSLPDSKNIAYTSLDLGLHMDLLYFESPPGLQFLHCVRNSTTGGESIFVDSFRAAVAVQANSQMLFKSLREFPVTYQYLNDGKHYSFTRPHIAMEPNSYSKERISHVNWAPPFQGPFQIDIGAEGGTFRQYISAVKQFAKYIDDPMAQYEMKLAQGECVIFMNRRVLHSRKAFDPRSGERWLKGTYVDIDAFDSVYRTLSASQKHEDAYAYID